MIKRYATDGSWVFCTSGIVWQKIKVSSQTTVKMHNCLSATLNDRVGMNMGGCPQMMGAAALIASLSASFLVMTAAVFAARGIVLINYSVCGFLTRPGVWSLIHSRVFHQDQNALMVEAQIPCVLGGMNTIVNVGDMILFAKFADFSYYRENDKEKHKLKYDKLINEDHIDLQEVKPEDLPKSLQDSKLWNNLSTGFRAKIFKDNLGRYVVAYRGTVTDDRDLLWKDVQANGGQAIGLGSKQYNNAMDLAEKVDKEFPDDEVIFTGHSKGGGEAAAAGTITGRPTYTYNSAGLSENTVARDPYNSSLADSKHIIALNSDTDILSIAQDGKIFIAASLWNVPFVGKLLSPVVAGIPQAAGKRTALVTDTFNPVADHGLEPLIGALKKKEEKKAESPQIDVIAIDL